MLGVALFIQCNKNTEILADNSEKVIGLYGSVNNSAQDLTLRDEIDCQSPVCDQNNVLEGYSIYVSPDPDEVGIPESVIGDCTVLAIFDITVCYNSFGRIISFQFDNYRMSIPEDANCNSLNLYLEDLEQNHPEE